MTFLLHHELWQLLWRFDGIWGPAGCENISPFCSKQSTCFNANLQKVVLNSVISYTVFEGART